MQPSPSLPSFLAVHSVGQPVAQPLAQPARLRLLDAGVRAPVMAQDAWHRTAPMPQPYPQPSRNQLAGQATFSTLSTGLGVASVFAPPVLPIAGVVGGIQLLDAQLGGPLTTGVGATTRFVGDVGETVVNGIGDAARGVGRFFGGLF